MYKVIIGGVERQIAAEGIKVENGILMFITNGGVRHVVPAGKWDYLEVCEGHDGLSFVQSKVRDAEEDQGGEDVSEDKKQEEEK